MMYSYECPRLAPELFEHTLKFIKDVCDARHDKTFSLNDHYPIFCVSTMNIGPLYLWALDHASEAENDPTLSEFYTIMSRMLVWDPVYNEQGEAAKTQTIKIYKSCKIALILSHENGQNLKHLYNTPYLRTLSVFAHSEIDDPDGPLSHFYFDQKRCLATDLLMFTITNPEDAAYISNEDPDINIENSSLIRFDLMTPDLMVLYKEKEHALFGI